MKRIIVLASGNGSNLQSIVTELGDQTIKEVISDNPIAYALDRARNFGIPIFVKNDKKEIERHIEINHSDIDLIVLAGYMKLLSKEFVEKFNKKIINIHPSYLPHHAGLNSIQRAYDSGIGGGVTIHYVDEGMDTGEIIEQYEVSSEGLSAQEFEQKVHVIEHHNYSRIIANLLNHT